MYESQRLLLIRILSETKPKGLVIKLKNKYKELYSFIVDLKIKNNLTCDAESIYWILNDLTSIPFTTCNHGLSKFDKMDTGYKKLCTKCGFASGAVNAQAAIKEKYGVDNIQHLESTKEKTKQTCLNKYGVESTNQLESVKQKKKDTLFDHYGTDGLAHEDIYNKRIQTSLDRYGVEHHTKTQEVQDKKRQTCIEKYGVDNVMKVDEIKNKQQDSVNDNNN